MDGLFFFTLIIEKEVNKRRGEEEKMKTRSWIVLTAVTVLTLSLSACIVNRFRVGPLRTDSEGIALGSAQAVRADIAMSFGEIDIRGGARDLMEAMFTYNVDELEAVVDYQVSGSTGRITIEHRDTEGLPIGDYNDVRSEWTLSFNDDVPMDLSLSIGASKGHIDLRGLELESLNVEVGAGEGDLWLGDNPLRSMDIEMGAGNYTIDMTGDWGDNLDAEITGGVGKLIVYLPSDVGVRVDVAMGIAAVEAEGLEKDGNTYTNAAFGDSDITLRIDIQGGVGDIRLIVRE
jgi:hypothetical protein